MGLGHKFSQHLWMEEFIKIERGGGSKEIQVNNIIGLRVAVVFDITDVQ